MNTCQSYKNPTEEQFQLKKATMKRSILKNKVNKSGKPADKTAYKKHMYLVDKLSKEAKKIFFTKLYNRKPYR